MVYLRSIHVSEQVCTYVHRRINGAELASHHGSHLLVNKYTCPSEAGANWNIFSGRFRERIFVY